MFFATDFWACIAFFTIEFIICILIFKLIDSGLLYVIQKFLKYVAFPLLVSQEHIRIHEAGHMVAYLKTCNNLKYSRYLRKAKKITQMNQTNISGNVIIETNQWNERNKLLLLGGCAATLKTENKQMNRFRYSVYFWLKGCGSDFYKLRHCHHMSKKTVIWYINSMIKSFTDDDMIFINYIANELGKKEMKNKCRTLTEEELFDMSSRYYYNFKNN